MQIGIDSFIAAVPYALTGENVSPADRLNHLLDEIVLADQAGLDVFGHGEHHRAEFLDSSPETILAAAAARTKHIRLASAVTVLSAQDPVRLFQQFATIDLLSRGRAEIAVGRGSFVEAYPLFGLDLRDYDSLFAGKLDLLLKVRNSTHVHWSGKHRTLRTSRVSPPSAKPASDLARCGRHAGILRASGKAGTSPDGRDHRRGAPSLPAIS
jgi:alkanesulfonate monooxygenase SsuD/methylene tetrahydromethanopterin reductase-like flavin-dependent oxidoreductase (luciferase family)